MENLMAGLFLSLGLLLFLYNPTSSQVIGVGGCPNVEIEENFDLNGYLGEWYEYARYPHYFEFGTSCVKAEYQYLSDDNEDLEERGHRDISTKYIYSLSVKNTAVKNWFFVKRNVSLFGTARLENVTSREGKLKVNFNGHEGKYWVLSTDQVTYSLVWSCLDLYFFHFDYFWVLTRTRNPDHWEKLNIDEKIAKRDYISQYHLVQTNQHDCHN